MKSPDYITPDEIRTRAFEIWEREGRPPDRELDNWLEAEQEERAKRDSVHAAASEVV